jgi:hypothetical protein
MRTTSRRIASLLVLLAPIAAASARAGDTMGSLAEFKLGRAIAQDVM